MKTVMYNNEEHLITAIAFNKDTKDWYRKFMCLLSFADGLILKLPDIVDYSTSEIDNTSSFSKDTHYALGVFKFIFPEKDKQKIFDLHLALGFRLGPAYRGENTELDKVFEDLKDKV